MKTVYVLMIVLFLLSLSACKEAAKSVGDAGNSLFKTVEDTINRDKD